MAKKKSQFKKSAKPVNKTKNKQAETEHQILLKALDNSALVSITDVKGNIIYANDKFVEVSKYSREMLIGQNHRILKSNLQPQSIFEDLWSTISSGRIWRGDIRNHAKDGSSYWVDTTISPVLGVNGKPEKYIAIRFLITDRKAIENKTQEASGYARSLIETSLDPLVTISAEGKITDVNDASVRVTGIQKENLIGTDFSDYFTRPDEARAGYLQAFEKGVVTDYPLTIRHKDGELTDVLYNASVYKDGTGKVLGVFAAARDVTIQKQADFLREGQIALSESLRGEQIISKLGQSILSHLVPFTNAQTGAFYVLTSDKKLQLVSCHALPRGKTGEAFIEFGEGLIGQVAIEKKSLLLDDVPTNYFSKIESANGGMIPRSILLSPVLYENEVIGVIELGSLYAFNDFHRAFIAQVSENIGIALNTSNVRKKVQKLLESMEQQKEILNERNEALNKAQVLLEEKAHEVQRASQYKTEFLANMSHELRTPLNSSLILAKLLMNNAKENLTEEQIQFATSIFSSGNDLLNLINDILDLSKVEAGKLDIRVENVLISNVMEVLKKTFQPLAQEKKLNFEVIFESDIPQSLLTDRQRLDQILKNLLSNAFKFTEKGSIKIRLYLHLGGEIAFEVRDSGIGIPKEQQKIIFEAFRQADGTTNRKYGGTGLGLSISNDLARLLGGSIEVDSNPGKGSCFTLILPRSYDESVVLDAPAKSYSYTQEKESNLRQPTASQTPKNFGKKLPLRFDDDRTDSGKTGRTILVIEDDIHFAKIICDFSLELNYKCIIGQRADEGFEMALEYNPDAILLDMKLSDHLGLTVLDRLKENPKTRHIPVIVMSLEDYSEAAYEMGAIGFMLKPFKGDEIKIIFKKLEAKFSQIIHRVLIVENDELKRQSISHLIAYEGIEVITVALAKESIIELKKNVFDCMIMNPTLPDMSGGELLEQIIREDISLCPPIIVYAGSFISREEKEELRKRSKSTNIKIARSPESLFNEVTLFLHSVESKMSLKQRQMLKSFRNSEQVFEGRKILLVDDDIRNIFALTSALEQKGATILVGRNGHEALEKLEQDPKIDLVLMDIMMPEMDGYEATRRIRKQKIFAKLPIIAVTAKAMKDDKEKCLEAGTNDYLSKPVDLDKLISLIRVWLPKDTVGSNVK